MNKGEFEWPTYVENGEDGVEVLGDDGELLAICIRPDIARRVADCLDGCRKIKDPKKTIPKFVQIAKHCKKMLREFQSHVTNTKDKESWEKAIHGIDKTLGGFSDG
jgi:hypothetical protein